MDLAEQGPSNVRIVTRRYIFDKLEQYEAPSLAEKIDLLRDDIINGPHFPEAERDNFIQEFATLRSEIKKKWIAAKRTKANFLAKHKDDWLQGTIQIPFNVKKSMGRPQMPFRSVSDRSKRRKTESLRSSNGPEELLFAGQMLFRDQGNLAAASIVKDILNEPEKAIEYKKEIRKSKSPGSTDNSKLTPTEALSVFIEASLSRRQYNVIREASKNRYPCYTVLQKAKMSCYPLKESYRVTETCAEINLQELLNHTGQRLMLYLSEVVETLMPEELASLELQMKWGCDGSQQAQYKQKFENSNDSDANIFQSSLVPLRLICSLNNKIIWQNPTPSSPRFCRPMRIRFIHETSDITKEEIGYFNDKISNLIPTRISLEGDKEAIVKHTLVLTMIDGKVCNAATETTSTMRCYICKATSKQFNDLSKANVVITENLKFGLSILHARIRFFETLLHLSYKLIIKKWQVRSAEDKQNVKERKQIIQNQFKNELGLIVDVPKAQYGNSNDGNTSRRFFANIETSATITGVDKSLIERFAVILEVISSGHKINLTIFSVYCLDTAKLYVELYPWHPMSPTVHKVLIHGPVIIEHALLPIGTLSEEAAEARNKHFRQYREHYARKFSREQCNMDVLNRLLLTSDPYISSIRKKNNRLQNNFSSTALKMLLPFEVHAQEAINHEEIDIVAESD